MGQKLQLSIGLTDGLALVIKTTSVDEFERLFAAVRSVPKSAIKYVDELQAYVDQIAAAANRLAATTTDQGVAA